MSLVLYCHPLASYCWKVLIALYEAGTPFEKVPVDLSDPVSRGEFEKVWPLAKFPVLRDLATGAVVPESSIIVEYLAQHHPGKARLLAADPDVARKTRLCDRFYDHYVHEPMQKVVLDRFRPPGEADAFGVKQARATLSLAYSMLERDMADRRWAMGPEFTLADCAAFPALYYADLHQPLGGAHGNLRAYLERLLLRPSIARVLDEARPYMHLHPR